jgi:RNA methyltransferase, TrmH family
MTSPRTSSRVAAARRPRRAGEAGEASLGVGAPSGIVTNVSAWPPGAGFGVRHSYHPDVPDGSLIPRFGRARRDSSLAVLEGLHPLKHALRFGANILEVVCSDPGELERLARELAPDVEARVRALAQPVAPDVFAQLAPLAPSTGVISLAERPALELSRVLADAAPAPLILLEDPRDLGNIGACVRVAAAASAAGVLTTGGHDPWHPDALRGAAGLHYALPVLRVSGPEAIGSADRPLLAVDPGGEPIAPEELPACSLLAFGGERYGLSRELGERADAHISIPMQEGVSSLNLATSVAAVLFAWRLCGGARLS